MTESGYKQPKSTTLQGVSYAPKSGNHPAEIWTARESGRWTTASPPKAAVIEATTAVREEKVRGYKVKVTHKSIDPREQAEKRKSVSKVISRSLKKVRDADDKPPQL
jgi:hypothetical protein